MAPEIPFPSNLRVVCRPVAVPPSPAPPTVMASPGWNCRRARTRWQQQSRDYRRGGVRYRYYRLRGDRPAAQADLRQDDGAFGTTLAPGSYVALFGTNFADPNYLGDPTNGDEVDTTFSNGRLPLAWDYATVSFDAPPRVIFRPSAFRVHGVCQHHADQRAGSVGTGELSLRQREDELSQLALDAQQHAQQCPLNNYTPAFFRRLPTAAASSSPTRSTPFPAPYIVGTTCPLLPVI